MIPRPFGRIAGAVAMLAAVSTAVAAPEPPTCALESEPQPLSDAVACLARAELAGAPDAIERLFERARQETAGGRFDAAGSLLDCAASVGSAPTSRSIADGATGAGAGAGAAASEAPSGVSARTSTRPVPRWVMPSFTAAA